MTRLWNGRVLVMNVKREKYWIVALIAYIIFIFCIAVINRDPDTSNTINLNLFWEYRRPKDYIIRDIIVNIACFVPIGILTGVVFKKQRVLKALLVGSLMSLTIEFSQLIWHRGVFDIDDLFNNTVGALAGAVIVVMFIGVRKRVVKVKSPLM